jgi:hypothetical protein
MILETRRTPGQLKREDSVHRCARCPMDWPTNEWIKRQCDKDHDERRACGEVGLQEHVVYCVHATRHRR